MVKLFSPTTGAALSRDGHALVATSERWPVIDEIAFLRSDRRDLADAALACLDQDRADDALQLLLGDQDDWAKTPPPTEDARQMVIRERDTLSFRAAMDLLALGPVSAYFAHRWSDPTFLSGLALAQAYWGDVRVTVLDVACGAGHYLRAFGEDAAGGDLVFAKLWLARHFVAPEAALVCFNAASPWPIADTAIDLVFCHDAFYFLPDKPFVAAEMMRVGKRVLVGHAHNALVDNLSAGAPMTPQDYADLFPGATLFDDSELTGAFLDARAPNEAKPADLGRAAAVAIAWPGQQPGLASGKLITAPHGTRLRRNPLYEDGRVVWPSERYRQEYSGLASYPSTTDAPAFATAGEDQVVDELARRRVLLDLPDRW